MRIRYLIPFSGKLIVPDHWEISLQGGGCRIHEEGGVAKALEVIFSGQPVSQAPRIEEGKNGGDIPTIIVDDLNLGFVRVQLEDAAAFLRCQFNVGLDWDEVESFYEAEAEGEKEKIHISRFKAGRHTPPAVLSFELLAGAIICAEKERGPSFEATLVATAREAMAKERYIDSFRYSFLLIESLYGDGKFKSIDLKQALKSDAEFRDAVQEALVGFNRFPAMHPSDTTRLLGQGASVDDLIEHLVDKRGHYFHGNLRRQDAWRPEKQKEAQALAALGAAIVLQISVKAARPMHSPLVAKKFREYAIKAGAQIMYQIDFTFRMPEDGIPRSHRLNVGMNGTKPTGLSTVEVIKHFIGFFENHAPMGRLEKVVCIVQGTGKKVFEMDFPQDEQPVA